MFDPTDEVTITRTAAGLDGSMGSASRPSWASDSENSRGPTSGEAEFYGLPLEYTNTRPQRGPLAGLDLVLYMRTGQIARHMRSGLAIPVQPALPQARCYEARVIADPDFRIVTVPVLS